MASCSPPPPPSKQACSLQLQTWAQVQGFAAPSARTEKRPPLAEKRESHKYQIRTPLLGRHHGLARACAYCRSSSLTTQTVAQKNSLVSEYKKPASSLQLHIRRANEYYLKGPGYCSCSSNICCSRATASGGLRGLVGALRRAMISAAYLHTAGRAYHAKSWGPHSPHMY